MRLRRSGAIHQRHMAIPLHEYTAITRERRRHQNRLQAYGWLNHLSAFAALVIGIGALLTILILAGV